MDIWETKLLSIEFTAIKLGVSDEILKNVKECINEVKAIINDVREIDSAIEKVNSIVSEQNITLTEENEKQLSTIKEHREKLVAGYQRLTDKLYDKVNGFLIKK
jgi:hypothetical protein